MLGTVFAVPRIRMPYASSMVFKEYKSQFLGEMDVSVLELMIEYFESLQMASGMEMLSRSAWPCRLVEESGSVIGFVMPAVPSEFFLEMRKASGVFKVAGEFQHLLNSQDFLARRRISLSDRDRYELLSQIAIALDLFRKHSIAVGDLSPKNMLFSIAPTPKVFFIDCDAMRIQGRSVMPQLETPGWDVASARPSEELGSAQSDRYKFALLALRLLVGDQTTRDPSRLPSSVPFDIHDLIERGLAAEGALPELRSWLPILEVAASRASTSLPQRDSSPLAAFPVHHASTHPGTNKVSSTTRITPTSPASAIPAKLRTSSGPVTSAAPATPARGASGAPAKLQTSMGSAVGQVGTGGSPPGTGRLLIRILGVLSPGLPFLILILANGGRTSGSSGADEILGIPSFFFLAYAVFVIMPRSIRGIWNQAKRSNR